ncbi:hypothetical protein Tcan_18763 [Toxocara canis]|uniref:Uncharacterized protein n=1 Tax=Toxocara canis TaxID=6265 RepID=A0A0B2VJA0_TOXCA|nr:hypothetical protein Tcan_18763 [Toxocara canis]
MSDRRRGVTSELDLKKLWLSDETPFYGSTLASFHPEYSYYASCFLDRAARNGNGHFDYDEPLPTDYLMTDDLQRHNDESLPYVYNSASDVYYFDSASEPEIRYPTPDYSPVESPSGQHGMVSVDCESCEKMTRVNCGRVDEAETDSGSSGYASSSISQKFEPCSTSPRCTSQRPLCCCSECARSHQLQSQIIERRNSSMEKWNCSSRKSLSPIGPANSSRRVKAVTFSEPLSSDFPSLHWPSPTFSSLRRRTTRIFGPAKRWLSLSQRFENAPVINCLPELQQRIRARIEAVISHELIGQLREAGKGANSSGFAFDRSEMASAQAAVSVGGLFHSASQPNISSERSSKKNIEMENKAYKTVDMRRPPLPPNPPSRSRILKYSNAAAGRSADTQSSFSAFSLTVDEGVIPSGESQGFCSALFVTALFSEKLST